MTAIAAITIYAVLAMGYFGVAEISQSREPAQCRKGSAAGQSLVAYFKSAF
jgi:hypothetical protein